MIEKFKPLILGLINAIALLTVIILLNTVIKKNLSDVGQSLTVINDILGILLIVNIIYLIIDFAKNNKSKNIE